MALVVYNTLSRRKRPFETVQPGKVGMYLCGPTVYKPSHIGHAVGPIIFDAIKRYLTFRGYDVTWVVNITDVDDKLIVEAAAQKTTTMELAERIAGDYLTAMAKLRVDGIDIMPKASEHMAEIIGIVQALIEKGVAYPSGGDVYFDVTKDADYGKLSNRRIEDQEGQRELVSGVKRNPGDFALWKAAKPDEPQEVRFESPWGPGRPGWHIECSAMAMRYLGDTLDIHGGGMDLIFPHHENELAQSESVTDRPFTNYWMHHGLTRVNTKKISKSDSDPEMVAALQKMTLRNLLESYPAELIRYFILNTHYRSPIEYSDAELASKKKGLETFYRLFERIERVCGASAYESVAEPVSVLQGDSTADHSEPPTSVGADAASNQSPDRTEVEDQSPDRKGAEDQSRDREGAEDQSPDRKGAEDQSRDREGALPGYGGIEDADLASACRAQQEEFERAMDDDFNTGVAIATLFEFAGIVNRFVERNKLDADASEDKKRDALAATRALIGVARLLGIFLEPPSAAAGSNNELTERVMNVLIEIRQHLRKKKDFETADLIRDKLKQQSITLEDRAGDTSWRVE